MFDFADRDVLVNILWVCNHVQSKLFWRDRNSNKIFDRAASRQSRDRQTDRQSRAHPAYINTALLEMTTMQHYQGKATPLHKLQKLLNFYHQVYSSLTVAPDQKSTGYDIMKEKLDLICSTAVKCCKKENPCKEYCPCTVISLCCTLARACEVIGHLPTRTFTHPIIIIPGHLPTSSDNYFTRTFTHPSV